MKPSRTWLLVAAVIAGTPTAHSADDDGASSNVSEPASGGVDPSGSALCITTRQEWHAQDAASDGVLPSDGDVAWRWEATFENRSPHRVRLVDTTAHLLDRSGRTLAEAVQPWNSLHSGIGPGEWIQIRSGGARMRVADVAYVTAVDVVPSCVENDAHGDEGTEPTNTDHP